jgi:hypothetical protein
MRTGSQRLGLRPALIRASSLHSRSMGPPSARAVGIPSHLWKAVGQSPPLSSADWRTHKFTGVGVEVAVHSGPEDPSPPSDGGGWRRTPPGSTTPPTAAGQATPELLELLPRDGGVELGHPVGYGAEVDLVHPHRESHPIDREIERQHAVLLAQLDPCSILFVLEYPCLRLRM